MPIDEIVTGVEITELNGPFLPPVDDTEDAPIRDGQHRYNNTTGLPEYGKGGDWFPYGSGSSVSEKNSTAIASTDIDKSYMNDQYPDVPEDTIVLFTNLTDLPDNIAFVQKYDADNQDWYILLYANKLT